jgi:hypothetical protein
MNYRPCRELWHAQIEMPVTLVAAPAQLWREVDRLGLEAVLAASGKDSDSGLLGEYVAAGVNLEAFRLRGWHAWQRLEDLRREVGDLAAELRNTALTLDGHRAANLAGLAVEEQLTAKGAEVEDRRIGFFEFPVIERELDLADEPTGEGDDDPALLRLAAGLYRTVGVRLDREGLDRAYRDLAGRLAGIKFSVFEMHGEERRLRLRRNALRQAVGLVR